MTPDRMIGLSAALIGLAIIIAPFFFIRSIADPSTVSSYCERVPPMPNEMEAAVPRQPVQCSYGYRPQAGF